jgi:hypothetical protein
MKLLIVVFVALVTEGCGNRQAESNDSDRDQQFEQMMSQVTLIGRSTSWKREGLSGEERYTIDKVSKLAGDTWLFQTRIRYGNRDVPVPIPITIRWAGDTPVITLTDMTIPGLGTYTARVLLYRDQYAGTWSGENVGGQLFGRIERN